MDFVRFRNIVSKNFENIINGDIAYEVDVDFDEFWNLYLDSFPEGTNEIYKVRREYDCSCCKQFFKNIANVVSIRNGEKQTVWDLSYIERDDSCFTVVADALAAFVRKRPIKGKYFPYQTKYGADKTYKQNEDGTIETFNHFVAIVPKNKVYNKSDIPMHQASIRDDEAVLERTLRDIEFDAFDTVIDLIKDNNLYRGNSWLEGLITLKNVKRKYNSIGSLLDRNTFVWDIVGSIPSSIARIRNSSIGVLLKDLSQGVDVETAIKTYENVVAPANYKRPKPVYTKKMLDNAKETLVSLGYIDSLERRFATLDDIDVNDALFINRDQKHEAASSFSEAIFSEMEKTTVINPKKFDNVEEVTIDKFVSDVLPNVTSIEAFVSNSVTRNLVSLIAPVNKDSKSMFSWNNSYSWAYTGNITDSDMKRRVASAGGKVDGALRFSIMWNDDPNGWNKNDEDAHCITPNGSHIYFAAMRDPYTGGWLDVDNRHPEQGVPAVENISWPDVYKMSPGKYTFFVHTYADRGGRGGFRAEIEFDGEIHKFNYPHDTMVDRRVMVADVILSRDRKFSIVPHLTDDSNVSSREVWGIRTNQFVPVSLICLSPNYWGKDEKHFGNKHYMFMLKGCKNDEEPNGFYNEFLKSDLNEHRKVFEMLGAKAHVKSSDNQLSGLGFSSTMRAELVVKVDGNIKKVLKIKF